VDLCTLRYQHLDQHLDIESKRGGILYDTQAKLGSENTMNNNKNDGKQQDGNHLVKVQRAFDNQWL
jgi:hypothetical protein